MADTDEERRRRDDEREEDLRDLSLEDSEDANSYYAGRPNFVIPAEPPTPAVRRPTGPGTGFVDEGRSAIGRWLPRVATRVLGRVVGGVGAAALSADPAGLGSDLSGLPPWLQRLHGIGMSEPRGVSWDAHPRGFDLEIEDWPEVPFRPEVTPELHPVGVDLVPELQLGRVAFEDEAGFLDAVGDAWAGRLPLRVHGRRDVRAGSRVRERLLRGRSVAAPRVTQALRLHLEMRADTQGRVQVETRLRSSQEAPRRRKKEAKSVTVAPLYAMVNLTYGTYSEVLDFVDAVAGNAYWVGPGGLESLDGVPRMDVLAALIDGRAVLDMHGALVDFAINEIVDRAYGARARQLRKLQERMGWQLPMGLEGQLGMWRRLERATGTNEAYSRYTRAMPDRERMWRDGLRSRVLAATGLPLAERVSPLRRRSDEAARLVRRFRAVQKRIR